MKKATIQVKYEKINDKNPESTWCNCRGELRDRRNNYSLSLKDEVRLGIGHRA